MQAKAAEEGRPRLHRREQAAQPADELPAVCRQRAGIEHHHGVALRAGLAVLGPAEKLSRAVPRKRDLRARVPAFEPRRAERVVGEKKVEHGMLLTAAGAFAMRLGPAAHAFGVRGLAGAPFRFR